MDTPNATPLPTEASAKEGPVIPDPIRDPSPLNTRPSKKFSLKLIIGIIFLLMVVGAAASYVYKDKIFSLVSKPTPTPTVILSQSKNLSPTPNPTTDWKTYTNHGVEFKCPKDAKVTENTNEKTQNTVYFELGEKRLTFERLVVDAKNKGKEAPYNETAIEQTFNNLSWKVVPPENTSEYCDSGDCSKTAPSFYIYKNEYRYSFYYYPDDLRSTINQILSTFKFTE